MTTHTPCPFCGVDLTELRAGKTLVHPDNGCILDEFQFSDDFLPEWERREGEPRKCCANCKHFETETIEIEGCECEYRELLYCVWNGEKRAGISEPRCWCDNWESEE